VGMLLIHYANAMHYAAHFVGGIYVHRDHKGDPNARPPFVIVEPQKQRAAMDFLQEQVFGQEAFQLPPQLYNYLAPTFWNHWGNEPPARVDFAVHDVALGQQERVLGQLLSPVTLSRLLDSELKVPADQEAFTAAEMLGRLTAAIFRETEKLQQGEFTNRKPAINSLRRNLQRAYVERLAALAMGKVMMVPTECQSVATADLEALEARIKQVLSGKAQLDPYTRAHLSETAALIRKVLDARIQLPGP